MFQKEYMLAFIFIFYKRLLNLLKYFRNVLFYIHTIEKEYMYIKKIIKNMLFKKIKNKCQHVLFLFCTILYFIHYPV